MPQLLINWFKADYIQGFLYVGGQEHLAVLPTAGPHFSARTHKQRHTPLRVPRGNLDLWLSGRNIKEHYFLCPEDKREKLLLLYKG